MAETDPVREQLITLLREGNAHPTFDEAVKDFPAELRHVTPQGAPHSAWELLEHMRIAQSDILEFSRNPKHVSPEWPAGYWPEDKSPTDAAWQKSIAAFKKDLQEMEAL